MTLHLQKELERLRKSILALAALVEDSVIKAVDAVQKRDAVLAMQVVNADDEIDQMEIDVEEDCLKILALHQPVAVDLRFIVSVLKINNDLERIGDLASKIAYNAKDLANEPELPVQINFETLAEITRKMLDDALRSLINMDSELADKVRTSDDKANEMKHKIKSAVFDAIRKHPERVEALLWVYGVARALERIADLTTNITEDVIYMIEGDIVRHGKDT